jgi:hypothetical protein
MAVNCERDVAQRFPQRVSKSGAAPKPIAAVSTMNEGIRVQIKQVWKRKEDGLWVRVTGLIFLEPKRVIWRELPNQGDRSADGVTTETEFKEQYEYEPQKRAGQN